MSAELEPMLIFESLYAEIERLKEANLSYSSTVKTQEHEIERLKLVLADYEGANRFKDNRLLEWYKLITELCSGIDAVQLDTCTDEDWDKLNEAAKRARDATR